MKLGKFAILLSVFFSGKFSSILLSKSHFFLFERGGWIQASLQQRENEMLLTEMVGTLVSTYFHKSAIVTKIVTVNFFKI